MCEAKAAVSVDTKSVSASNLVNVVMVCSGCVKVGNFAATPSWQGWHASALKPSYAITLDLPIRRCRYCCRTGALSGHKRINKRLKLLLFQELLAPVLIGLKAISMPENNIFGLFGAVF
jgi:hypothetical protein